jgi:hypothetical protein
LATPNKAIKLEPKKNPKNIVSKPQKPDVAEV